MFLLSSSLISHLFIACYRLKGKKLNVSEVKRAVKEFNILLSNFPSNYYNNVVKKVNFIPFIIFNIFFQHMCNFLLSTTFKLFIKVTVSEKFGIKIICFL